MPCSLCSKTKFGPLMKDCRLSPWRHVYASLTSHFTCCFFLSCSLLTTDKLRLAESSLNKPEQGVPNTSSSISVPASSQASWTKARCKHTFYICRVAVKTPLHLWWEDKCVQQLEYCHGWVWGQDPGPWCGYRLHHCLSMWPWASNIISWCLSCYHAKNRFIITGTQRSDSQ